jgi:predicted  nucleic acid-binding Zn-ribbon protein
VNPDTITSRIHAKADEDLKKQIEDASVPLRDLFRDGCRHTIDVYSGNEQDANGNQKVVQVIMHSAFEAIKNKIFANKCERNREEAIRRFMAKVESLDDQLQELRDSIPQ